LDIWPPISSLLISAILEGTWDEELRTPTIIRRNSGNTA